MAFTYKLDKVSKLGEYSETYGVTYWCEAVDDLTPIKFNSQNQDIKEGDTITAEERAERKSTKGTVYYQLKKVKVSDSQEANLDRPNSETKSSESSQSVAGINPNIGYLDQVLERIIRVEEKIDKLLETKVSSATMKDLNSSNPEERPY